MWCSEFISIIIIDDYYGDLHLHMMALQMRRCLFQGDFHDDLVVPKMGQNSCVENNHNIGSLCVEQGSALKFSAQGPA